MPRCNRSISTAMPSHSIASCRCIARSPRIPNHAQCWRNSCSSACFSCSVSIAAFPNRSAMIDITARTTERRSVSAKSLWKSFNHDRGYGGSAAPRTASRLHLSFTPSLSADGIARSLPKGDCSAESDSIHLGCPSRKSYPRIAMMQSGQDWCGDDGPRSLYGSS
jgi:hypothetical protein